MEMSYEQINFISCSFPMDKSYLHSSPLPLSLHVAGGSLYASICWLGRGAMLYYGMEILELCRAAAFHLG
jgi:hypothetical protein